MQNGAAEMRVFATIYRGCGRRRRAKQMGTDPYTHRRKGGRSHQSSNVFFSYWPTCLQLLSIDYPARAVYVAGLELW